MQAKPARLPADACTRSAVLALAESVAGLPLIIARERYARLSRRERQVAALMALGKPYRKIAAELGIGIRRLETCRSNIKLKLGICRRTQLVNLLNLIRLAEVALPVAQVVTEKLQA
jgi:DNA-binding CsgD family transcriptional regulator